MFAIFIPFTDGIQKTLKLQDFLIELHKFWTETVKFRPRFSRRYYLPNKGEKILIPEK